MKYVIAFLVLSIIIIVHEFGHFILAKASGVTVTEFSLGMGPRLIKFKIKGTMYSLKLFLFGGSCRMLGEDENDSSDGSFNSASVWRRMAIVIAGPFFNFILAFVLSVILIGKAGYDPCIIYSVDKNSAAEEAGLMSGDQILEINGHNINFYGDYSLYIIENEKAALNITYLRDGVKYKTKVTPKYVEYIYQMGVYLNSDSPSLASVINDTPAEKAGLKEGDIVKSINGFNIENTSDISPLVQKYGEKELTLTVDRNGEEINISFTPEKVRTDSYVNGMNMANIRVKCTPASTIKYAFKQVGYWIKAVFKSFKLLFSGKVSANDVSGPVGIVSAIGNVVSESASDGALYVFLNLLNWTVMISANLGVMNLLPIPALDGGRLVFLIIEAIRRKPIDKEKEGMVHFIGIVLLMVLMVVVLFNDIRKLF